MTYLFPLQLRMSLQPLESLASLLENYDSPQGYMVFICFKNIIKYFISFVPRKNRYQYQEDHYGRGLENDQKTNHVEWGPHE